MNVRHPLSRRRFFGGVAAAMGALGLRPGGDLFAQGGTAQFRGGEADYDAFAKLASNENNFGPPQNVMQAMNHAWKYANRYGYPDGNVVQEIAAHHGVKPENVLLTPGSGEVLEIVGEAFLLGGKKVVGADPTYATVYQHATNIKAEGIKVPLLKNYQQDLDTMISEANKNASTVGLFYLCNPNNPTGMVISAADVKKVVEGIPKTMPILIDEAYHHFVDDPAYGTSVPYVIEGRPVIIARTFSKIAALAAMRIGYAVSTPEIIKQLPRLRLEQRERAGQARRGGLAQGHRRPGRGEGQDHRAAQQDHARARGPRLPGDPVADQLLHGQPRGPHGAAGDRGVPRQGHPRRPSVPADGQPPARLGRPARGDGQVHQDLQGDLPEEGATTTTSARG